ncbi:MAG: hypothetical protein ACRDOU_31225, partial [Streptosporangiaceae bacterium]
MPAATVPVTENATPDPGASREWLAPFEVDIRLALGVHRRGPGDPAYRVDAAGAIWRTMLTPDGPGTLRVTSRRPDAPRADAPRADAPPTDVPGPG